MQNIFDEVSSLDTRCYKEFSLSEDILMEHAADGMADFIRQNFPQCKSILISCGSGNNGADGMALARLLHKDLDVKVYLCKEPSSIMAKLQYERIKKLHIDTVETIEECDIVVDAVFGTGLTRALDEKSSLHLKELNALNALKIACDVPTGLHINGVCDENTFSADYTLTMGALKRSLFSDAAKDFVGEIKVLDLGLSRNVYETPSKTKLLDLDDMRLPHRKSKSSHKGSYGHLAIISGEKLGASVLCASAALRFGAALVTLLCNENPQIPTELMLSHQLPKNSTAVALGMGLGIEFSQNELERFLDNSLPLLLDADIFYHPLITSLLKRENIVLTPHPKEFTQLLRVSGIADITVDELQNERFRYTALFAQKYKNAVLVLKGANVIIAKDDEMFVNPHGTNVLAKGGSGDILGGLIASLLAQGYTPLDASVTGSLAHTKLALNYEGADFSLSPNDLIDGIKHL
ncbi:NAD(P)H-hydrate dehydratase [Sulfurimonas sp. HSL-1716]|uniref:NAD(P)H-hydrate dehydratase n=1 Tax=Hydrocurvibacter sulfurireducens TaxID=3131937 RepID=UPI0031F99F5F